MVVFVNGWIFTGYISLEGRTIHLVDRYDSGFNFGGDVCVGKEGVDSPNKVVKKEGRGCNSKRR